MDTGSETKTSVVKHPYSVTVPWRQGDTIESWDQTCAWVVEQFGLPGDRFMFNAGANDMDFCFRDSEDAVFFSLRWS